MDTKFLTAVPLKTEVNAIEKFKFQSLLSKNFGDEGLHVYMAIDGNKSIKEILNETGIDETKLIDVISFMDSKEMIKFAKPVEKIEETKPGPPPEVKLEEVSKPAPIEEAQKVPLPPEPPAPEAISPEKEKMASPIEEMIFEKFGKVGVDVYNLIDGEKTAEEILIETGITESLLVEILEFMNKEGIIKLEKPAEEVEEEVREEEKVSFAKPLYEEKLSVEMVPEEGKPEGIIDIPTKEKLNVLQEIALKAKILGKYKQKGINIYSSIDDKKPITKLAKETGLSFKEIDEILNFLVEKKAIKRAPVSSEDIKRLYGSEGVTIYEKYGRDGILLYELIDRHATIKEILLGSKIEPERAIDIFLFIHKVLGLDLPLDRETLLKQIKS